MIRSSKILSLGLLSLLATSWSVSAQETQGESILTSDDNVRVSSIPFEAASGNTDTPFSRHEGGVFGLDRENTFSPRDFYPPFFNGAASLREISTEMGGLTSYLRPEARFIFIKTIRVRVFPNQRFLSTA